MSKANKTKMPKWLDITLKVIEWTLIIFIVVCMLSLLAQRMTGNTPELFGYSTYTVATGSMSGTYEVGDIVLCKRIKDQIGYNETIGFKEGDVIAFIAPAGFDKDNLLQGHTVTHRIFTAPYYDEESDTWYVETKGDAAPTKDRKPIPLDNIQGIIVGTSKGVTSFMKFITKWYGFATIVVIPLLGLLVWQIVILAREKERAEQAKLTKQNEEAIEAHNKEQQEKIEELKAQAIKEYEAKQSLEYKKENEIKEDAQR